VCAVHALCGVLGRAWGESVSEVCWVRLCHQRSAMVRWASTATTSGSCASTSPSRSGPPWPGEGLSGKEAQGRGVTSQLTKGGGGNRGVMMMRGLTWCHGGEGVGLVVRVSMGDGMTRDLRWFHVLLSQTLSSAIQGAQQVGCNLTVCLCLCCRYFAAKLWQGESYYMQIDAHMFFAEVGRATTTNTDPPSPSHRLLHIRSDMPLSCGCCWDVSPWGRWSVGCECG
jgi:hypothetical protein